MIDGICHPYNFSEENLAGSLYAFHPLLTLPETALSKEEWQHDWRNDERHVPDRKAVGCQLLAVGIRPNAGGASLGKASDRPEA